MDRIVRQIDPEERGREKLAERRLSAFLTRPNIVLLGDPGAGKSHTFRDLATSCGGRYLTARSFLTLPVRNTGELLFIDGLDERRAGRGDRDTVDTLAAKLIEADPAAVRISCRVADWLGKSDLVSLGPFFEGRGGMVVLVLEALTPDERRAVLMDDGMPLAEADELLRGAEERGLSEFLGNPQNLLLLRQAVKSGPWPATRSDLFEMATRLMLQEKNSEHARTGGGTYAGEELWLPAGAAMAARLISDIEAISLADQEGTQTVPSYRTLPFFAPDRTMAALGRRVFTAGQVPESIDYVHRTTAEYLGAAWLAQTVRAGLPIGRVIALMGVDGHPAPELRGLHAWLAVHLPEHAERLIDADPYGILVNQH
jgi:predicted NACHT family NTPase